MDHEKNGIFTKVRQIGIITDDLEKYVNDYEQIYGITKSRDAYYPPDSDMDSCLRQIAYFNNSNVEMEVIEAKIDHKVWSEFIKKHGKGLHHIQYNVCDFARAVEQMTEKGISLIERGHSITVPEVEFAFFDTVDQLGFVTEIVNVAEYGMD